MKRRVFLRLKLFFFLFFEIISCCAQERNPTALLGDTIALKGFQYFQSNEIDSCLITFNLALEKYKEAKAWASYIISLNNMAQVAYISKRYTTSFEYTFKASRESKKYLTADNEYRIIADENLNIYYGAIGDYQNSLKILKKTLAIKNQKNTSKLELAKTYSNLGNMSKYLGDFDNAFGYYNRALKLQRDSIPNSLTVGETYHDIARVFTTNNQIDSALFYFNMGETLFEQIDSNRSIVYQRIENLLAIAELHILSNNFQMVTNYIKEVDSLKPNVFYQIQVLETLGKLNHSKGIFDEAVNSFIEAEKMAIKHDKRNTPPIKARRLIALANSYYELELYENALNTCQEALIGLSNSDTNIDVFSNPPLENIIAHLDVLAILNKKSEILLKIYNSNFDIKYLLAANDTYSLASNVVRNLRGKILSSESKIILAENSVSTFECAIETALMLYDKTKDDKYKKAAFSLAESNKALLLLESINEQTAKGYASIPDSILAQEKELKLKLAFIDKSIIEDKAKTITTSNLKDQKFDLQQELDQLTSNFEKNYPRYFDLKYKNDPIELSTIQQKLAEDNSALIEYFAGEKNIFIFSITKDDLTIYTVDDPLLVQNAIQQLRPILSKPPGSADPKQEFLNFSNSAFDLYSQLLKPVLTDLPKDIKSLTIIPDDQLNYIPFGVLLSEIAEQNSPGYSMASLQYVMEDYSLNYHYSATLLHKSKIRSKTNYEHDFLGLAPSFKTAEFAVDRSCSTDELYSLKCSQDEVKYISDLLSGDASYSQDATTSKFKNIASDYRIIHLATHACVDETDSNLNKIFFTDDYLSSFDLYNLELNTELAVLSACNTGSGELIKGEGVMNLARGFINAGCASTMVSMWSVDDCATSDIMLNMYKGLKSGMRKDEALRAAKLNYLGTTSKTKMHPYYWAPFVSFGDAEVIEFSSSMDYLFILTPLLLLGLAFLFFRVRR